jgi:tetratricopeptide (TPR) repeat protein
MQADYPKAREYLEAALVLYRQAANLLGESRVLNSLGIVLLEELDLEAAKTYLEQSLEMKRLLGDRFGMSVVLANLGTIAILRYEFEGALKHFQENLVACQEIEDYEGVETALIGIGYCRMLLGEFEAARQDLEKAAEIAAEIGDRAGAAESWINQSMLASAMGQPEQGLRLAELARVESQEIQARSIEASACLALGKALEQLEKFDEAFSAFQTSLQIREQLGQPALRYDAWAGLARLSLAGGDTQQAEVYGREILHAIQTGTRMGSEDLALVYLSCYGVLVEEQPSLARQILEAGYRMISENATRLHDERLRRSYLEVVPSNRRLQEIWKQQFG